MFFTFPFARNFPALRPSRFTLRDGSIVDFGNSHNAPQGKWRRHQITLILREL